MRQLDRVTQRQLQHADAEFDLARDGGESCQFDQRIQRGAAAAE